MDRGQLKLDDAVFDGRLRLPPMPAGHVKRSLPKPTRRVEDVYTPRFKSYSASKKPNLPVKNQPQAPPHSYQKPLIVQPAGATVPATTTRHQPLVTGALPKEYSNWLTGDEAAQKERPEEQRSVGQPKLRRRLPLPYAMAAVVFIAGIYVSFTGFRTNNVAQAQINKIAAQSSENANSVNQQNSNTPPSTTKPSSSQISSYSVPADSPRYINIPFIGVYARVFQTGLRADGSLGTPGNVYDTAWYEKSAKPGQAGAMVVDGHISSWTTNGVFYDLDKLRNGDLIQITRGDGKIFNYRVVKNKIYDAKSVDMAGLMVSADTTKPGLNLISCSGDVIPGTNEFNKRLVIYAVLQ